MAGPHVLLALSDRIIGGRDPAAQLHFIIDKIEGLIKSLGGQLEDVVRTEVYFRNILDLDILANVHREWFKKNLPVNKFAPAAMVSEQHLVEMRAEAMVSEKEKNVV